MNYNLIGLTGQAGCGKDTFADFLCEAEAYRRIAFADPLKDAICNILGVSREKLEDRDYKERVIPSIGKSPRQMMQTLGTEWGRERVNPSLWTVLAEERINVRLQYRHVVVTDVRFENEASLIRNMGGIIIKIHRYNIDAMRHASEAGIELRLGRDLIIINNKDLSHLKEQAILMHGLVSKIREMNNAATNTNP
jgi:hypothetical protein